MAVCNERETELGAVGVNGGGQSGHTKSGGFWKVSVLQAAAHLSSPRPARLYVQRIANRGRSRIYSRRGQARVARSAALWVTALGSQAKDEPGGGWRGGAGS